MLTPAFELKQDENFLTIIIRAPFAKISETEVFIEENDFKFYSSPYYLRLTLPGNIVEDSREKADYDASAGVFTIRVPKETPGEHFEGLDMLTKLLAPKGERTAATPLIQVIETKSYEGGQITETQDVSDGGIHEETDFDEEAEDGEEEFDWFIEQTPFTEEASPLDAPKYGFANQKSGVFQRLQEELCGIVDVPEPDKIPASERRRLRKEAEDNKFDPDHFIADQYDDELIQDLLHYKAPWVDEHKKVKAGTSVDKAVIFTEEEREKMRNLPRKEYLLDEKEEPIVYLGLVDIIFAYCYNHRTTEGENNVESGWTISKLSATLSWLETFNNIQDVIISSFRRSLCYPLYHHWQLTLKVLEDVRQIFQLGQRRLLKCLLEVHSLLMDTESRYILNDLYITDYCVWVQSVSEMKIKSLAEALDKIKVTKEDIGFQLEELEREAASLYEDENVENITEDLEKLSVAKKTENDASVDAERIRTDAVDSDDTGSDNDSSTSDSDDSDTDQSSSVDDDGNTNKIDADNIEEPSTNVNDSNGESNKFLKNSQETTDKLESMIKDSQEDTDKSETIIRLSNGGGETDLCCCDLKGGDHYETKEQIQFDENHKETELHKIPAQLKAKNNNGDVT